MNTQETERAKVLLRAAYDILERNSRFHFVEEVGSTLTHYDDADCDGYCLKEDIGNLLGLDEGTDPLPLDNSEKEPQ